MSKNSYLQVQADVILQKESAKRAFQNAHIEGGFTFFDTKGEVFKLQQILPELQRAMNCGDIELVKRLCILSNKRLKLIFNQYD